MKKFVALLSSVWQKDDSKLDTDDRALCKSSKLSYALLANLLFFSFITENQVTRRDAKELYHRTWAQFASPSHVEICHSSVPLSGIMTVCVVDSFESIQKIFRNDLCLSAASAYDWGKDPILYNMRSSSCS
jgi:hypothetical protein